jgi:hypothetical protein
MPRILPHRSGWQRPLPDGRLRLRFLGLTVNNSPADALVFSRFPLEKTHSG